MPPTKVLVKLISENVGASIGVEGAHHAREMA